jgi:hypothetical protein
MYGGYGYGELAYSEQDHVAVDSNASFDAFLALVTAKRTWLLELDALSLASSDALSGAFSGGAFDDLGFSDAAAGAVTGGVQTQRYSSDGYTSKTGDLPAYTWYDGRITAGPTVQRRIAGRNGIGGLTRVFAEISLDNTDGALDLLTRNYALDGRAVTILLGRPTDARSAFGVSSRAWSTR